jgi:Zn-dependent peptidase ImmA (M78 family)/DNA-binding XRE family transcriptional regulator
MATPKALVKPELLVWARKRSGLSLEAAARKITVKPEKLAEWEAGEEKPSIAQLRKAAAVYKFSLAVFFLPEPPEGFEPIRDFRRAQGSSARMSSALVYGIRRAQERRELALELASAVGEPPIPFKPKASTDEDPEIVGARLRSVLGVSLSEQSRWGDAYAPLRRWKQAVEALGVLVFEFKDVEVTEARGFSRNEKLFPVIGLNGADSTAGRCFSLCHELAHLLLRAGGVCEFFQHASVEHRQLEEWCNHVAAAVLMPKELVLEQVDAQRRTKVDFDALERLARKFSVSQEAMVVRLVELDRLPRTQITPTLDTLRQKFSQLPKPDGQPQQYVLALKKNGAAFSALVLAAYRVEAITLSDVAIHLEMKLKHLPKLQVALFKRSA